MSEIKFKITPELHQHLQRTFDALVQHGEERLRQLKKASPEEIFSEYIAFFEKPEYLAVPQIRTPWAQNDLDWLRKPIQNLHILLSNELGTTGHTFNPGYVFNELIKLCKDSPCKDIGFNNSLAHLYQEHGQELQALCKHFNRGWKKE